MLPTETELTWEIDFEKKTAKCDVAEVRFTNTKTADMAYPPQGFWTSGAV